MTTLTTPRGTKLRTETKRRYVLVHEAVGYPKISGTYIVQRSDDLSTLRRVVQRDGIKPYERQVWGEGEEASVYEDFWYILHVATGESQPLDGPIFRKSRRRVDTWARGF